MAAEKDVQNSRFYYVDLDVLDRYGIEHYKSKQGENILCILPPADPSELYFRKVHVHCNIGVANTAFVCLKKMYNKRCPICEEIARIRRITPFDERLRGLEPVVRYLYFVVDMSSTSAQMEGVWWYDAPRKVTDEILKLSETRSGNLIDVSDPIEGRNVCFTRQGRNWDDTIYCDFRLEDRESIPAEWLENLPVFDEVLKVPDYNIMKAELQGYAADDEG